MDDVMYHIINVHDTIVLEKIDNGCLLISFDTYEDSDDVRVERVAFEFSDDGNLLEPDFEKIAAVLWEILESFGGNSKHFKKRLEIKVVDTD